MRDIKLFCVDGDKAIGHYGTDDLEIRMRSMEDIEKARPLFERSYEAS